MGMRRHARGFGSGARAWQAGAACLVLLILAGAVLAFAVAPRHQAVGVDPGEQPARVSLTPAGLAVQGKITPATPLRFAAVLAAAVLLDADGRTSIALDSRGGNLDAALLMRRMVKAAQPLTAIDTWVGPGQSCQSACTVLFATGSGRGADPTALFMFHAPAFAGRAADPTDSSRTAAVAERSYLAALAEADPALVHALKARGVFDSTMPSYAQARQLVAGGWRFVTRLGEKGGGERP